jgi:hypothetical protein
LGGFYRGINGGGSLRDGFPGEKWEKSKRYIGEIIEELRSSRGVLEFKGLAKKRGFLIYVTPTYPSMVPYLKGIHETLDGWRRHRDKDGWKLSIKEIAWQRKRPTEVKAAPRLKDDLEALQSVLSKEKPPKRRVRSSKCIEVFYGFGDASATGHAANFQRVINKGKHFSSRTRSTIIMDTGATRSARLPLIIESC